MKNKRRMREWFWMLLGFGILIGSVTVLTVPPAFAQDKDTVINQALDAVQSNEEMRPSSDGLFDPTVGILDFQDKDILDVLHVIGEKTHLNIIADDHIRGRVTVYLEGVDTWDALRTILEMNNLAYTKSGDQVTIMTSDEFVALYSHPFNDTIQTKLISLTHSKPEEMMEALLPHKSEQGKVILIKKTGKLLLIDDPKHIDEMRGVIQTKDVAMETKTFTLRHVTARDIKEKVGKFLSKDIGVVREEKDPAQITITDTVEQIPGIAEQVVALDKEIDIAFVGKIIQITLNEEHQQGIDWPAVVSNFKRIDIRLPQVNAQPSLPVGNLSLGTISQEDSGVLMEALGQVGPIQTMANPSVTVKPQQEAGISLTSTKPFQFLPQPDNKEPRKDFHLELSVTPAMGNDGAINLKLNPQFHWLSADNGQLPVTASPVEITIKENEMIVLSGLFQEKKISAEKKVPLLGDLPVLGSFFKAHRDLIERNEFVIFLTPKIIIEDDAPAKAGSRNDK